MSSFKQLHDREYWREAGFETILSGEVLGPKATVMFVKAGGENYPSSIYLERKLILSPIVFLTYDAIIGYLESGLTLYEAVMALALGEKL